MSDNNSALASLTATYTDSENEDLDSDDNSQESENSISQESSKTKSPTPKKIDILTSSNPSRSSLRLVSYNDNDDFVISDEENNDSPNREDVTMVTSDEDVRPHEKTTSVPNIDKYAQYDFLPPEPKGKPSQELVDKINNLYEKMKTTNMDMNRMIQNRKEFRNPSIYEKLIQFCDINEFGTNYPPEIYNPLQWGPESYYAELAKVQKTEMLKREKERKDADKSDQAAINVTKKVDEESKKRKSKWDQPGPTASSKSNTIQPALTSNVTGTKGTVISAFGTLPKKTNQ